MRFEHKGKKYIDIDFKNQFTFKQNSLLSPIVRELNDFSSLLKDKDAGMKILERLIEKGLIVKILAHAYLEVGEEEFDAKRYEQRLEDFQNLPMDKIIEIGEIIPDFLSSSMRYTMDVIQVFSQKKQGQAAKPSGN